MLTRRLGRYYCRPCNVIVHGDAADKARFMVEHGACLERAEQDTERAGLAVAGALVLAAVATLALITFRR